MRTSARIDACGVPATAGLAIATRAANALQAAGEACPLLTSTRLDMHDARLALCPRGDRSMAVPDVVIPGRATAQPVMEVAGAARGVAPVAPVDAWASGLRAVDHARCPHPPFGHLLPQAGEGQAAGFGSNVGRPVAASALAGNGLAQAASGATQGCTLEMTALLQKPLLQAPVAQPAARPPAASGSRLDTPQQPALTDPAVNARAHLGVLLIQRYSASLRRSTR